MIARSFLRRPRSSLRRPRSAVFVAVAAASALGLALFSSVNSATSASAHAELVKITPELNAQLSTVPHAVALEFNEPVSTSFATVVITTAAGVKVTVGKPVVVGAKVSQALSPRLDAGAYRVSFRVVSADRPPGDGRVGIHADAGPEDKSCDVASVSISPGNLIGRRRAGDTHAEPRRESGRGPE